jgi:membrane peptidoglycan carboxypeptidase
MVSTIANGGVYLPPHVLMPGQVDANGHQSPPRAPPQASPFKPGGDLPNPLPAGAHRVLSTLTAAQMRKMMEGVVLYGTGKQAQLNGYSSGGKTGTAQKIDPATHLYSKTMHVASFAGIAPVNNPVIAVAVIMDSIPRAPITAQRSPRRSLPRWRSRCSSIWACRTTSMCAPRAGAKANAPWPKTTASTPATLTRSMPRPTICPATIRCARGHNGRTGHADGRCRWNEQISGDAAGRTACYEA